MQRFASAALPQSTHLNAHIVIGSIAPLRYKQTRKTLFYFENNVLGFGI